MSNLEFAFRSPRSSKELFNIFLNQQSLIGYRFSISDEAHFFDAFSEQLSALPFDGSHFDASCFDLCGDELRAHLNSRYMKAVNSICKYTEQICFEHKKIVLRNYFILPYGDRDHIKKVILQVENNFAHLLSEAILTMQNTLKISFAQITHPLKRVVESTRFNVDITTILESYYIENSRPNKNQKEHLAKSTGLSTKQIEVWFNNRRNRAGKNMEDYGKLTNDFLEHPIDWADKFQSIENGSLTHKDAILFICNAFDIDRSENETHETNEMTMTYSEETISRQQKTTHKIRQLRRNMESRTKPYSLDSPMTSRITSARNVQDFLNFTKGTTSSQIVNDYESVGSNVPCQEIMTGDIRGKVFPNNNNLKISNKQNVQAFSSPHIRPRTPQTLFTPSSLDSFHLTNDLDHVNFGDSERFDFTNYCTNNFFPLNSTSTSDLFGHPFNSELFSDSFTFFPLNGNSSFETFSFQPTYS
ncbi:13883_t:CDS:1 [Acaulospora colombiana]|uniref:13883_t:CDS:1 n=1 Tax=Acaulospora colombiana TaxID=27376 RepID=A0ACA9M7B6_9GLOM|nr:13883_t:CDS:1 [Acaulospora colombiana]